LSTTPLNYEGNGRTATLILNVGTGWKWKFSVQLRKYVIDMLQSKREILKSESKIVYWRRR